MIFYLFYYQFIYIILFIRITRFIRHFRRSFCSIIYFYICFCKLYAYLFFSNNSHPLHKQNQFTRLKIMYIQYFLQVVFFHNEKLLHICFYGFYILIAKYFPYSSLQSSSLSNFLKIILGAFPHVLLCFFKIIFNQK